jgi:hypothetical protein
MESRMAKIRIPVKKKVPSEEQDRIIIRLPEGLHAKLKAAAADTRQTMTQVAVTLIEQGLLRYKAGDDKTAQTEVNADNTLVALNEVIERAQDAKSAFQAMLLAQVKPK